jgi:hypothetical protein
LKPERGQLRRDRDQLTRDQARLERERDRLRREIERLTQALAAARRAGKRQVAPFSKGARCLSGGNRSMQGAEAQEILSSLIPRPPVCVTFHRERCSSNCSAPLSPRSRRRSPPCSRIPRQPVTPRPGCGSSARSFLLPRYRCSRLGRLRLSFLPSFPGRDPRVPTRHRRNLPAGTRHGAEARLRRSVIQLMTAGSILTEGNGAIIPRIVIIQCRTGTIIRGASGTTDGGTSFP